MDFRPMRRHKQVLSADEINQILQQGTYGILSVWGDNGYPYTVPLNYVCHESKIYFHCAKSGHKLDAIRSCDKCSFCVVDQSDVVPVDMTTYYRSVIAFGRVRILDADDDLLAVAKLFAQRFNPSADKQFMKKYLEKEMPILAALEMQIEHISGKEAIELTNEGRGIK